MRQYYVQIQCFIQTDTITEKPHSFIEEGFLEDHGEYLVYRDLVNRFPEAYRSMSEFKRDFVHDIKDFKKYVKLLELK